MAKRSPILGYNHNVRYRGLVFHVQTEDSGLLSPHLFTHLFYGGVIISTRKLVYDAGAAEDAIKSLMQAQHKAVLKDLKKGNFDDKIDQYLGGTPGLEPRGNNAEDRASSPAMATPPAGTPVPQPPVVAERAPSREVEPPTSRLQTQADSPDLSELAPPDFAAVKSRTKTADRGSAPSKVRTNLPPPPPGPDELGGPTLNEHEAATIAAAVAAANASGPNRMADATVPTHVPPEMSPLEIELELDEPEEIDEIDEPHQRQRPRDTDIAAPSDLELTAPKRMPGESVPPLPPAPPAHPRASSSVGAATLPPKPSRLPSRPAITPPQVVSRPLAADRRNDDAVEVYAPPPPSVDPPPGAANERPGQYAQHRRASQKIPAIDVVKPSGSASGSGTMPGFGRPSKMSTPPTGVPNRAGRDSSQTPVVKPSTRDSGSNPIVSSNAVPQATRESSGNIARTPTSSRSGSGSGSGVVRNNSGSGSGVVRNNSGSGSGVVRSNSNSGSGSGVVRNNSGSGSGVVRSNSGSGSGVPRSNSGSGSGVVMTRPAVIVGAPAKPAQPPRVRKAREEEGRGFGQGLISEKSLDEVILAYLSEDADEK